MVRDWAKRGPMFRMGTFLVSVLLTMVLLMERFDLQKSRVHESLIYELLGPTVHLLVSILAGLFSQKLPPLMLL